MSEVNAVQKTEMPEINSPAAIVVTQHEGKILLEKNAKKKMYPAFVTKLLASIIALEKCNPNDVITISNTVIAEMAKWKGSASINLTAGEKITILDLVYAMMLSSANDAMFAIAEYVSGDKDKFSVLMEEKAASMGTENTIVTDQNGHFTAEQFSNAYDIAIICRYCMTNRIFRTIANTEKHIIGATNKSEERILQNTNLLINSTYRRYRYDTAIGIKSGYTVRSKACLACSALPPENKYGEEVLVVLLGAEHSKQMKYVFYDAIALLDFTFDNFEMLSGKKAAHKTTTSDRSICTITQLCDVLNIVQRNAGEADITTFAIGKQKIKPGCAYFSENEEAAKSAYEKGASVIISNKAIGGVPNIVVDNLQTATTRIAAFLKSKLSMWSIAVLDSPDKINPLNMAAHMLADRMSVIKSSSPDNNYVNAMKAILSSEKETQAFILNVSPSVEGNVERVSRAAAFDIAVLTSAVASKNPRDLSKAELISEKLNICSGMSEAGAVIMNIDDKNLAGIFTIPQDVITIGVDNRMADYYGDNISIDADKISFDIVHGADIYHLELYSADKHSVYQALATFALGEIMGIAPKHIISSIEKFRDNAGLNKVKNENNVTVISDFENVGGESVGAALKELCSTVTDDNARRIAVFAEIDEGDDYEIELFKKVGALINKCSVDITVCYGKIPAHIAETADHKSKFIALFESEEAVKEYLRLNIRPSDVILFKGSDASGLADIMTEVT